MLILNLKERIILISYWTQNKTKFFLYRYTYENTFQLNFNPFRGPNNPIEDRCHPKAAANRLTSQDYIRIPGGINANKEFQDYYCDTDFNPLSTSVTGDTH